MSDEDYVPKSSRAPLIVALMLLLGLVGGVAAFFLTREPIGMPSRIVVGLSAADDSESAALLLENFEGALSEYGFDVVHVDAIADDNAARAAAEMHEAAHALQLTFEVSVERPGVTDGLSAYMTRLETHLVPLLASEPTTDDALEFVFERSGPRVAVNAVVGTLVEALGPSVLEAVMNSRSMTTEIPSEAMVAVGTLRRHTDRLTLRRSELDDYAAYCRDSQEDVSALSEEGVSCVGDPCGQITIVGARASDVIVQDVSRAPLFGLRSGQLEWLEPPEAIRSLELSAEGTLGDPLFRAGHFYTFGFADRSNRFLSALPFSGTGRLGVIALDVQSGETTASFVLAERERVRAALPSGQGDRILVWIERGGMRVLQKPTITPIVGDDAIWVPQPSGPDALLVRSGGTLRIVGTDGGPLSEELPVAGRVRFAGTNEGHAYLVTRQGADCDLHRIDLSDMSEDPPLRLDACLREPTMAGGDRIVGVAYGGSDQGDPRIAVVNGVSGEMQMLTNGAYREEALFVTGDGRVVFNRRLPRWPERWDLRVHRRVVCWTDLPE